MELGSGPLSVRRIRANAKRITPSCANVNFFSYGVRVYFGYVFRGSYKRRACDMNREGGRASSMDCLRLADRVMLVDSELQMRE